MLSFCDSQQGFLSHTSHSDLSESIDQVSQRYFDGRPVPFNNRQERLDRLIKGMEDIIDLYNRTLASHASHHHIDLQDIKQVIQPHVRAKATYFVDRAKAETLFQFDDQDAAVAVLKPYVGDKAGEFEVLLDDGATPRWPCCGPSCRME